MRGMFRFGCGSAYSSHSYSAQLPGAADTHPISPDFRSFLHAQSNQYAAPPQPGPNGRVYELVPGVRADEAFDVAVFLVALAMVAAAVLGTCFFLAWFGNLRGNTQQQRGAYGMPISQSPVVQQPMAVAPMTTIDQAQMQGVPVMQPMAANQPVMIASPAGMPAGTVQVMPAPTMQSAPMVQGAPVMQRVPVVQGAPPVMQTTGPVMQTSAPLPAVAPVAPAQVYGPMPPPGWQPAPTSTRVYR